MLPSLTFLTSCPNAQSYFAFVIHTDPLHNAANFQLPFNSSMTFSF